MFTFLFFFSILFSFCIFRPLFVEADSIQAIRWAKEFYLCMGNSTISEEDKKNVEVNGDICCIYSKRMELQGR